MKMEISITCPNCKRQFDQRVEDMRPRNTRQCPSCGSVIQFTGDDGRKTQRALDDLQKSLRNLSVKIKL